MHIYFIAQVLLAAYVLLRSCMNNTSKLTVYTMSEKTEPSITLGVNINIRIAI